MPITRILHLSDLRNCGSSGQSSAVRGAAWEELLDAIADVGLVDLIAVTGDLSVTGRSEEFSAVTPFIEGTCARLGVSLDRVFAVPGGRDLGQGLAPAQEQELLALARRDPAGVSAWIAGGAAPPDGADPAWYAAVFARQRAFWRWLTDELRLPEHRAVDALGYRARLPIAGSHAHLEVYGLNSAWLGSRHANPDTTLLGREQVLGIVRDAAGAPRPGLRVALVHHPPAALADAEACVRVLDGAVDLVLCGRAPHPRLEELVAGARVFTAGSLSGGSAGPPSCQLIQIETDAAGRPIGFAARIWTWSSAGSCWLNDAPELPAARRGRLYWSGTAPAAIRNAPPRSGRPRTLEAVLEQIFASSDELRKWLYMRAPEIYPHLPGGTASISELAFAAREHLEKRGLFDDELLDALADFSPAHGLAVVALGNHRATVASTPTSTVKPVTSARAPASPQTDSILQRQLNQAQQRRDNLRGAGLDATAIESEILTLRRMLRQGPATLAGEALGDGRYVLQGVLGRGGFATVWRARDSVDKCDVALKILHPQDAQDAARRERFSRGARAMQKLKHPAVVRVLSLWGAEQAQPFFVMEFVDGPNLHEAVIHGPRLAVSEIVEIACTIGEALAEAHAREMVHRDVKPANILLDRRGSAFLTDFDLVRARDTTGGTRTGGMGTVLYAAPELVQNAEDADPRADIYGLGMTVLFMLFGKELPYKDTVRNPEAILERVECAAATKQVILQAIAWDREKRFPDIASFCVALRSSSAPSPAVLPRAAPSPAVKRRAALELWAFAVLALALVSTVVALGSWSTGPPAALAKDAQVSPIRSALDDGPSPPPIAEPTPEHVESSPPLPPEAEQDEPSSTSTTGALPPGAPVQTEKGTPGAKQGGGKRPLPSVKSKVIPVGEKPLESGPAKETPLTAEEARPLIEEALHDFGDKQRRSCRNKVNKTDTDEPLTLDEGVDVRVTVDTDGRVTTAVSIGEAEGTPLADCMAERLKRERFTPFRGNMEPFILTFKI